jgi:hypothetical protein
MVDDYFIEIVQFLSTRMAPLNMIVAKKKHLVVKENGLSTNCGELIQVR